MAKLTLEDITNITGQETSAINTINANSALIETALENTLSRDGTSPNTMSADIDMNGNNILNVANIEVESITIDGVEVTSELYSVGPQGPQGEQGPAGPAGSGSGDLIAANNLSDVSSAATSFSNIKQAATDSATGVVEHATQAEALAGTAGNIVITAAVLKAIVDIIEPVGTVKSMFRIPSSNWLELNGGTIGSASSGATSRANADVETLFTVLWEDTSVSDLPIYSSTGVLDTKGASAAADFAANKRLALPDLRDKFIRGKSASRALSSAQAESIGPHSHTASSTSAGNHSHTVAPALDSRYGANTSGAGVAWSAGDSSAGFTSITFTSNTTGAHTHTITVDNNSGTENRPANVAFYICVKY